MAKSKKAKWRGKFDKQNKQDRPGDEAIESEETSEQNGEAQGNTSTGTEGAEMKGGACGTTADEIPDDNTKEARRDHRGRLKGKQRELGRKGRYQKRGHGREETSPEPEAKKEANGGGTRKTTAAEGQFPASQGAEGKAQDEKLDQEKKQARGGGGRGASREGDKGQGPSSPGKGKPSYRNQEQRPGRPFAMNADTHSPPQDKTKPPPVRRVFPAKCVLDLKTLKEMNPRDVVCRLNESMARFKFFLRSPQEEHNSDEFIFDLTCILAIACSAPLDENTNTILAALKGSVFLSSKIPRALDRLEVSTVLNEQESQRRLIQSLIKVFMRYLRHLPSSYADLPYSQLKQFLDQSSIDEKDDLQRELEALKQTRDDLIIAERQKHGKRYIDKAGQKPPNDFRDIPICPTNKEITSHARPFLRKNILKGRYEDAEHYLDVQFRLLREDFLEPLREGIHEIVHNVPRKQRNQLMKQYQGARIVDKKFTKSGIIYQVQFDVSRFDTKRWAHSKRLLFGSFLCLSNNNFETMLFATVSNRDPEEMAVGIGAPLAQLGSSR